MTFHEKTYAAARGKWRGILLEIGIPATALTGKHVACPMCGGEDRFRWDNKDQRGTYFCNACGAGDGLKLVQEFTGKPYKDACDQIDALLGNVKPDGPVKPAMSEDDRMDTIRRIWTATKPVQPGDLAHAYLASRRIEEKVYAPALRFGTITDGEGGIRPCMVAMVGIHGDKTEKGAQRYVTMHRTFLKPDGSGKAEMESPRKLLAGEFPPGACVMLSEWTGSGALGIAEGIETAMSASALFDMPVWAALTADNMEKWTPPEGCEEVAIFGDNDASYRGHAAAYRLAFRLTCKRIPVTVHFPQVKGQDWNDVLMARK